MTGLRAIFLSMLLLAAPMAARAIHVCTDSQGKSSIQDKPCDAKDAAPQHAPAQAQTITVAHALDAANRLTAAMQARDVTALRRLLGRGFQAHITRKSNDVVTMDASRFAEFTTRALDAAKSYRVTRTCRHDPAGDSAGVIALRCRYSDRLELFQRVVTSQGDEFLRVSVDRGEVKLLEMSEAAAADAMRARVAQR